MTEPSRPVFLERASYRRRRLVDAARLLPLVGAALFAIPLLWPQAEGGTVSGSRAIVYIFGTWAGLIATAFLLSRAIARAPRAPRAAPHAATGGDAPPEG